MPRTFRSTDLATTCEVGDMAVVVDGYDEAAGTAIVDVTLGGVDDLDGASEFRLVVLGESVESTGAGDDACGATTIEPQACRLTFDVDDAARCRAHPPVSPRRGRGPLAIGRRWRFVTLPPAAPVTRRYRDSAHG